LKATNLASTAPQSPLGSCASGSGRRCSPQHRFLRGHALQDADPPWKEQQTSRERRPPTAIVLISNEWSRILLYVLGGVCFFKLVMRNGFLCTVQLFPSEPAHFILLDASFFFFISPISRSCSSMARSECATTLQSIEFSFTDKNVSLNEL